MEEALLIDRPDQGTWQPSPIPSLTTQASATYWASPVPRVMVPSPMGKAGVDAGGRRPLDERAGVEVDMVMRDLDTDAPQPRSLAEAPPSSTPPPASPPDAAVGGAWGRRPGSGGKGSEMGRLRSKFAVEQLIASPGSLPSPMYPEEREAAARSVGPTATFEMLAKVPREMLEAHTDDAQALRRSLVRGATVVFASAGYPGKRFIFERAAQLGVKSVVVDHPDSWSRGLVEEGIIAKFLPVDMSQSSEDVFRDALMLISRLGEDGVTGAADGVATFVELSVPLAARLSEALGLPGFRPEAVDIARDKHRTRAALEAAGLPTPRNVLIRQAAELPTAGCHVGFPAVLKPVSGAASLGVKKVDSLQELEASYREVMEELSSLVVSSGALVKNDGSGAGVHAAEVVDLTVLLEQYLDGTEVDIDIVMSGGEWRYAAVSDNGPTQEPYFNETWGLGPSKLPVAQQRALKDLAVNSVKACGFTSGIFHVECKYTSTGPQLIEVNARMGGGPVRETNRLVWGVDLVEEAIFCALGIPSRPMATAAPKTCIGYYFVNARRSGRLRSTAPFEKLSTHPGVLSCDPCVAVGEHVTGLADGMPTWICQLVTQSETPEKALELVLRLERDLDVELD